MFHSLRLSHFHIACKFQNQNKNGNHHYIWGNIHLHHDKKKLGIDKDIGLYIYNILLSILNTSSAYKFHILKGNSNIDQIAESIQVNKQSHMYNFQEDKELGRVSIHTPLNQNKLSIYYRKLHSNQMLKMLLFRCK